MVISVWRSVLRVWAPIISVAKQSENERGKGECDRGLYGVMRVYALDTNGSMKPKEKEKDMGAF